MGTACPDVVDSVCRRMLEPEISQRLGCGWVNDTDIKNK